MRFDTVAQDLRSAIRNLRRAPGFALLAILTLAVGIGANTAIFSVLNAVILRPAAYPRPDQLMFVSSRFPAMGFNQFWVSPPEYFELTEINQSFSSIGAYVTGEANVLAGERPRRVSTGGINAELLETLAVPPQAGRWFRRDETRINGPQLVMLSDELWRSAFASRPDIVGQTIEVNGVQNEVVGIMPPGFDVMDNEVELWLPLQLNPSNRRNRGNHFLNLIGRVKEGTTPAQAEAELASLVASWGERTGAKDHVFIPGGHALQMEPMQEEIVGSARLAIWVLQAAVGFVLLIACANFANLLLARAETRHREFAVRTAIGASRWRLLMQFVSEGCVLALAGGAVGLVLAWAGVRVLVAAYPDSLPRAAAIAVDPSVLAFTFIVSLATGVVFGLAPLLHLRPGGLHASLKEGGVRGSTSARHGVRRVLVVAEVALAVVLVVGAGLMLRTVMNLTNVDPGFDRSRLVTFGLELPGARYTKFDDQLAFYRRLFSRLEGIPGVMRASGMTGLPPNRQVDANDTDMSNYTAPTQGPYENVDYYQRVAQGYFETMGIPIVEGRGFEPGDTIGPPVAVVNETLVRTFWKDLDPIGQQIRQCCGDQFQWLTVVGVAKDVKQGGVDQKTGTELYFLIDQFPRLYPNVQIRGGELNIVLRSAVPMSTLGTAIESIVREVDPSLPVIRLREMDTVFRESLSRPRLLAQLLGGFAALALFLASIGTYGLLSYLVTERRREIGIRMALGAERAFVLRHIMGQGLRLALFGLAGGMAGAFALTRLMSTLLFNVEPNDPATLVAVAAAITGVAALACFIPAQRATRVDPVVVLRDE
jgi:putative ABC transport system permease protein